MIIIVSIEHFLRFSTAIPEVRMRQHLVWIGACIGIVVGFVGAGVFFYRWELEVDFTFLLLCVSAPACFFASIGKGIEKFLGPPRVLITH